MDVRDQLLQAALRVFSEAGWRGATTRRIAQEAGVSEVTLFRQFGSKEALIHEALSAAAGRSGEPALPDEPSDPLAELTAWSQAHFECMRQLRSFIRRTIGEHEEHPEIGCQATRKPIEVARELRAYLEKLQRQGLVARDWDVHVAANMLLGTLFANAITSDLMPERYGTPETIAPDAYVRLFVRSLGVPLEAPRVGEDTDVGRLAEASDPARWLSDVQRN
jgi:AcrR family transcriptional regulator